MAENADEATPDAAQAQLLSTELAYTIEMVRTFLDWRHNVLTRFAVASAALGAAAYVADSKKAERLESGGLLGRGRPGSDGAVPRATQR